MALDSLTGITRRTLHEQAFELLLTEITRGGMAPGDRLGEVDLATRLGVSRTTIREALRSLQERGLVVTDDRGKHQVARPTPREIRELFRVRAAVEGLAATEIIASPDREALVAKLREALPLASVEGRSFSEMLDRDLAFHEALCRLSGNSVLTEVWLGLRDRICVVILTGRDAEPPAIMGKRHHESIVDAVAVGDVEVARRVVSDHMTVSSEIWAPSAAAEKADQA